MLALAKEYGCSPEDVENWEPYWFNRALLKLEGEGIHAGREQSRRESKSRRK